MLSKILDDMPHYLALMRFDKPIGWLLLMWPTLAACWVAGAGHPNGVLVWIFVAGVIVMRAAGCVVNDYADREVDHLVARTAERPLASGALSAQQALRLFIVLGLLALALLLMLPSRVWPWSIPALLLTIVYPFMKRFFQAPQLILGLAFSFGIPMVYVAFDHVFDAVFWLLLVGNIAWVIAYDSAYAMADREDDIKIGVRSTALLFGNYDRALIGFFQAAALTCWILIGLRLQLNSGYFIGLLVAAGLFAYQQWLMRLREPEACFRAFLNNGWLGAFVWFGLLTGF